MVTDETTRPEPRAVERAGSHFQPKPVVAGALLVAFVAAVVLVLHSVSPISISGTHKGTTTTTAPVSTTTIPRARVTVQVANGTDRSGLARGYTTLLDPDGWDVLTAINAPATNTTRIYYHAAFKWAAQAIQKEIGAPASSIHATTKSDPIPDTTGDDVVVVLGNNAAAR